MSEYAGYDDVISAKNAEIDRLRAEVETSNLAYLTAVRERERAEAEVERLTKEREYYKARSSAENEALREAGEGLYDWLINMGMAPHLDEMKAWREVAGEKDEPLTPAEKEAVAMGCDPGDMLTPEEQADARA